MNYIDKRPIFTVGQVWSDFVKRLPRSYPRYRHDSELNQSDLQNLYSALGANLNSQQQYAAMAAQYQQHNPYGQFYPFPPYSYYSGIFGYQK